MQNTPNINLEIDKEKTYNISEQFGPTIQGEGPEVGEKVHFLRMGGCDFKCSWCDTIEIWTKWEKFTAKEIIDKFIELDPTVKHVILTGGNPAIHNLDEFLDYAMERGYTFSMETQGSRIKPWFSKLRHVIVSPKPPSAGMHHFNPEKYITNILKINELNPSVAVKIPVGDEKDIEFFKDIQRGIPNQMYMSIINYDLKNGDIAEFRDGLCEAYKRVVELVLKDPELNNIKVYPQQHTLIWGNRQGV